MNSNNAYTQGFCKAAKAMGVNPYALAKIAGVSLEKKAAASDWLNSLHEAYTTMDPTLRRSIIGGLITGAGTYMLSDNNERGSKLSKGLIASLLGGLGTYAMDRSGVTNKAIDYMHRGLNNIRPGNRYFS